MRRALVLFVVFVSSYTYFYEGGGWNQNTRFNLVRAIVERHTLRIDAYHQNTGDKAHVGDHYYTDKAPGASLIAVPAVAIVRGAMNVARVDANSKRAVVALSYVATVAAAGMPAALAAVAVFWFSRRFGASDGVSALAAVACGLGTPLWPYATLLYGHALTAGCLVLALVGATMMGDPATERRQIVIGAATGFAAGWAVITEFPASIASAVILGFGAWQGGFGRDRTRLWRVATATAGGLAAAATVLLTYNWLAFQSPFHIAYSSEEGYEGMKTGIFGVSLPQASVAKELLFGSYRGLLPLAPVLVVVPAGFWWLIRDRASRGVGITAATVAAYYFFLTAGYAYWSGGWSYGSRHLGPLLPFVCLAIAPIWRRAGPLLRVVVVGLTLVGVAESLIAVATTPQPPSDVQRPMADLLWPMFRDGDFPIGWQSVLDLGPPPGSMSQLVQDGVPRESWNLGQLVGLHGHASLIPLGIIWLIAGVAWLRFGTTTSEP